MHAVPVEVTVSKSTRVWLPPVIAVRTSSLLHWKQVGGGAAGRHVAVCAQLKQTGECDRLARGA